MELSRRDRELKLTIFAVPKPFRGHIGVIQRNAVTSWSHLRPRPDIILFGDEAGTAELCRELGVRHVRDVAANTFGTPLVSAMFATAQELAADGSLMCFINSDIVLTSKALQAVDRVSAWGPPFLMVGRRFEVDINAPIEFDDPEWEARLTRTVADNPLTLGDFYIDWFVFPRGALNDLPPFAVGRTSYDNWLLWHAVETGLKLVDATVYAPIFHQRHGYPGGKRRLWTSPESQINVTMLGHWSHKYTIGHARWMLNALGDVVPARGRRYRLARPMVLVGHLLRFTRPLRLWLEREPGATG